jgi:acetyltransferase-like isoleucine patch superfamily enzyme
MFGPNVTIRGGNHNIEEVGVEMFKVKHKRSGDDKGVTIYSDTWIGTGCILLSGSIVNTGSILAAGSVLTKEVPEYEIWGGVPAKKIKSRFTEHELCEHKRIVNGNR